jgi:hypothetical protein
VAVKVWVVVMTSSPGPMPSASSARCSPAVAELTAMQCSLVAQEGGEVLLEARGLGAGGDPARAQRVDHFGDLLLADLGQREGQERAAAAWSSDLAHPGQAVGAQQRAARCSAP